jgi:hypothetical protein
LTFILTFFPGDIGVFVLGVGNNGRPLLLTKLKIKVFINTASIFFSFSIRRMYLKRKGLGCSGGIDTVVIWIWEEFGLCFIF